MIVGVLDLQRFNGRVQQIDAEGLVVLAAHIAAGVDVLVVAFLLVVLASAQLRSQLVKDREVEDAFDIVGIVITVPCTDLAAELSGRLGARDIDDAADRVASEHCSLGTTQDFYACDIEALEDTAGVGTNEHTVDNHADRRVETLLDIGNANAADSDRRNAAGTLRGVIDHQVRRHTGKILEVAGKAAFHLDLAQRAHRDGNVLHPLLALTRGDDYFFESGWLLRNRSCPLRQRDSNAHRQCKGCSNCGQQRHIQVSLFHPPPLGK